MATIANLVVEISAKGTKLARGLKKSLKAVGKFTSSVTKTFAKLGGIMAAAFTGAGVAIVAIINKQANAIDKLSKTSTKLGIAIGELQKLEFQAGASGVSTETLSTALQRMVRRISEASNGTGVASKALEELGLNAENLNKLSPDVQFNKIAEAMRKIGNSGDQVRLAMSIFDTEGVGLVNTFNSDLEKTGTLFDSLGIKITSSQSEAVARFQDSKQALGAIFDGFLKQVTAELAPAFASVVEHITESITRMGGLRAVAKEAAVGILDFTLLLVDGFILAGKGIDNLLEGFVKLKLAAAKTAAFGSFLRDTFGRIILQEPDLKNANQVLALEKELFNLQKKQGPSALSGVRGALQSARDTTANAKVEISVVTEEGVIVDKVTKSDKFDLIVEQKLAESTKAAARQVAR